MDISAYLVTYKRIGKFQNNKSTGIVLALTQAKGVELANELMDKLSNEQGPDVVFKIHGVRKMKCDFFLIQDLKSEKDGE